MMAWARLCQTLLVGVLLVATSAAKLPARPSMEDIYGPAARGWSKKIKWRHFRDGITEAIKESKPALVLFHAGWCKPCQKLKERILKQEDTLLPYADKFVMISAPQKQQPHGAHWFPDGVYAPRIMYVDPTGKVRPDIYNFQAARKYKYSYMRTDVIYQSMRYAHAIFERERAAGQYDSVDAKQRKRMLESHQLEQEAIAKFTATRREHPHDTQKAEAVAAVGLSTAHKKGVPGAPPPPVKNTEIRAKEKQAKAVNEQRAKRQQKKDKIRKSKKKTTKTTKKHKNHDEL